LLRGPHDGSICETGDGAAIPVDVVRDLCRRAGATVTAAVSDANGVTVAVGERVQPEGAAPRSGSAGADTPSADHRGSATDGGRDTPSQPTADLAAMIAEALAVATGDPLRTGRDLRLANRAQRRALRAMYRSCAHPGCRVPFADCFIHHVTPWEDEGPTDLTNLLPLCGRHHHQIHEGGWRLTIDPARTLRWYRPGGRLDTEERFEPLGATAGSVVSGSSGAPSGEDDSAESDAGRSTSTGERATRATDPATDMRWTRSRSARGAPPATEQEALRLFDPTAA
jgi:hypothetical protein